MGSDRKRTTEPLRTAHYTLHGCVTNRVSDNWADHSGVIFPVFQESGVAGGKKSLGPRSVYDA